MNSKTQKRSIEPMSIGRKHDISVSFEFFPPNNEEAQEKLWSSVKKLEPYSPDFVSVTYGAGGSTRERTHSTIGRIIKETSLSPAAHLTCIGATKEEVNEIAKQYWDEGIRHIVALRGDIPDGCDMSHPKADGYEYALDLVKGLKELADFEISVAAYPEGHPQAPDKKFEIDYLKQKIDAGATRAITQFFFDNEVYLRFRDQAVKAGINVDIVPGILPVTNFGRVKNFAKMCGASVPDFMHDLFDGLDEEPRIRQLVAATLAAEQCRELALEGVKHFHFYTLNRAVLTRTICHILGLRAKKQD